MAYKIQAFILLFTLFTLSLTIGPSHATECASSGGISVYWGQNAASGEGNLRQACATGNYNYVILNYLHVYDDGSTPELDLYDHCDSYCADLEPEIQDCQSQGIKVFLSIGKLTATPASKRSSTTASSSSEDVVNQVAQYIYENFLSNQFGPLGTVALDGIDILGGVPEGTNIRWDELVGAINAYNTEGKIYLSASPHCDDKYLGSAIETGLFHYIWVQFFHEYSCDYRDGTATYLFASWNKWTSKVLANNSVFLGIPGAEEVAVNSGYIPPDVLKTEVLPYVQQASNYGGVMVWNRFYDKKGDISGQIKDIVPKTCTCVCDGAVSRNFYGLLSQSL